MHLNFIEFQVFGERTYDTLDPLNEEFINDFDTFDASVKDLDYRLASVIGQAMDDCPSAEHFLKLLAIVISLMDRPIVREICLPKYKLLVQMLDNEMETVKRIYDHHVNPQGARGKLKFVMHNAFHSSLLNPKLESAQK
ncbi:hypothetical protein P879_11108 [Paragonimus westermani]|uniref:Dynein heavy chain tail domain-containing protein n=1 Tax=Paragonimus westermani TaxID=34504 RepID=A0A8T0D011_9TREM|nr:hypothetical protein P879_11108 [Paragonimus westermani]